MKVITKYQAIDGSEWESASQATERDRLCHSINVSMTLLPEVPPEVTQGKGWFQHDIEAVRRCKDEIFELCREEKLHESFPIFKAQGRDVHAMSVAGRILNDMGGPLDKAWNRFARIDEQGREHQQPFYANNGPLPEHVCLNP